MDLNFKYFIKYSEILFNGVYDSELKTTIYDPEKWIKNKNDSKLSKVCITFLILFTISLLFVIHMIIKNNNSDFKGIFIFVVCIILIITLSSVILKSIRTLILIFNKKEIEDCPIFKDVEDENSYYIIGIDILSNKYIGKLIFKDIQNENEYKLIKKKFVKNFFLKNNFIK